MRLLHWTTTVSLIATATLFSPIVTAQSGPSGPPGTWRTTAKHYIHLHSGAGFPKKPRPVKLGVLSGDPPGRAVYAAYRDSGKTGTRVMTVYIYPTRGQSFRQHFIGAAQALQQVRGARIVRQGNVRVAGQPGTVAVFHRSIGGKPISEYLAIYKTSSYFVKIRLTQNRAYMPKLSTVLFIQLYVAAMKHPRDWAAGVPAGKKVKIEIDPRLK